MSFATDGASNTVVVSEIVVAEQSGTQLIKGGVAIIDGINKRNWTWGPSVCLSDKNGSTGEFKSPALHARWWYHSRWADGRPMYTGFNTILPPNAPSCQTADADPANGIYTATSNHKGGVNCARLDGSVFFCYGKCGHG
jgi:prepilin-type processing-associated H-X9-DG protein